MAIKLPSGFVVTTQEPIDFRLVLTKEQMRTTIDERMPDNYFALCPDDNCIYYYDKNNTVDVQTGKFRLVKSKLYQEPGQHTDGAMSQKTVTDGIQSITLTMDSDEQECLKLQLPWGNN